MQKPFWKIEKNKKIINFLEKIIIASGELKIKLIVIPLVDKGSIQTINQEKKLLKICKSLKNFEKNKVQIIFESDYHPKSLEILLKIR